MSETQYTMSNLASFVGKDIGVSPWMPVAQETINTFAECTGDRQWIHVDVQRAQRESPFGAPIAHGFLTLSLIAKAGMELGIVPSDAQAAFNYGLDKVRFINPVKAGSWVRCQVTLLSATDQGQGRWLIKTKNVVEIKNESKPALIAEALTMLVAKPTTED